MVESTNTTPALRAISYKAIIVASIIDVVGSGIVGAIIGVIALVHYGYTKLPPQEMSQRLTATLTHGIFYWISLVVGLAFSIFAGYLAARIAKRRELFHGALSSFLCVLGGIGTLLFGKPLHSLLVELLGLAASPALGIIGGYIRLKTKHSTPSA